MLYNFVSDNHARCNTLPEKTMLKFTFAEILTINGKKGEGNTAQQLWISADSLSCGQSFTASIFLLLLFVINFHWMKLVHQNIRLSLHSEKNSF